MDRTTLDHPTTVNVRSTMNAALRPDPLDGLPALIPIPLAAELLGLSRASAYRYAAAGELPTRKFGRRVYVITSHIRSLLIEPPDGAAFAAGEAA